MADEVIEVDSTDGKVKNRRFDQRDFDYIADYVIDEFEQRKRDRSDRERQWKDIDRQVAMEPEVSFKKLPNGQIDKRKLWMAETELPLQAQALEVLTADSRRMLFPNNGPWFRAHGEMTDAYLKNIDFKSIMLGDENEVPSKINQDNIDKLVEGYLLSLFEQPFNAEDFYTRYDRINAEAFKYGMGVGRARIESKTLFTNTSGGVSKEQRKIPVLYPVSVKNLYLDDVRPSMHSAQVLEPAHIARDYIKFENLQIAASRGSTDPENEDGGWMPKGLAKVEKDDKGYVTLLEMEGDIVVPRKTTRSMVIPGCIVTVAIGAKDTGGKSTRGVVRLRFRKFPFSSYLLHPYHYEGSDDIYPTGPLMKGRPVQMLATDITNRLLDSAMLKNSPPVGYDRTDMVFAQAGGPEIYPNAQWGTTDDVKVHAEVGGDPSTLAGVLSQAINLYAELTGVLPARLGAQTTSHTTAFAKDAELQRGAVRTVDYVNQIGAGPMTKWLSMAYEMARSSMMSTDHAVFYIDSYGGYVEIDKTYLPERASFEWFGAGGPQEAQQKTQTRLQALALALKMDQLNMATGKPAAVNINAAIAQVLRDGGWTDLDAIVDMASQAQGSTALGPGPAVAALQNLSSPIQQQ